MRAVAKNGLCSWKNVSLETKAIRALTGERYCSKIEQHQTFVERYDLRVYFKRSFYAFGIEIDYLLMMLVKVAEYRCEPLIFCI